MAIISLVAGILGIVCCGGFLFGIAALIWASWGARRSRVQRRQEGRWARLAGLILRRGRRRVLRAVLAPIVAGGFDSYA